MIDKETYREAVEYHANNQIDDVLTNKDQEFMIIVLANILRLTKQVL